MTSPAARSRLRFGGLLLLALLAVPACDDLTDPDGDGDINGTWVAQFAEGSEYIHITDDGITVYSQDGTACYERTVFEIVSSDGTAYSLAVAGSAATLDVRIERVGDDLRIRAADDTEEGWTTYAPSSQELDALDVCTGGGGDAAVACQDLPALALGGSVSGALSTDDPTGPSGPYYDLYGLTLGGTTDVTLSLSSPDFDTRLWLYDAGGALIAENDDADFSTLDSALEVTLDAGCYRVEASSYDAGEVGAYTLEAAGG